MYSPIRRISVAAATTVLVAAIGLAPAPAQAEPVEHIDNGTFDSTTAPWWDSGNVPTSAVEGQLCSQVPGGTTNPWDASIGHSDVPLVDGAPYVLTFTASASVAVSVNANVQLNEAPFSTALSQRIALTPQPQTFNYQFNGHVDSANGVFTFQLGGGAGAFTFCLDNVSLTSDTPPGGGGAEQVENGDFAQGMLGWFAYGTNTSGVVNGQLCADVPGGLVNPWDAGIGQNNVPLVAGTQYTYSFDASGVPASGIRTAVQLGEEPFTSALSEAVALTPEITRYTYTFTSPVTSENGQVVFHVGAVPSPYRICIDNVSLLGGEEEPPYVPDTGPRVRVNQVGYLPHGPKRATIVTAATSAVAWQLTNASGTVVAQGQTSPRGVDAASGQNVHTVDFSSFVTVGAGYKLSADGETSHPFDISGDIYQRLRSDALQFFYIQRSGIAIDGNLVGAQYARPAGHVGVAPNQGDTSVPCKAGVCDYRLDVRGGWYDAGDHGKYVVNGGIATYQLLSTFERAKTAATARHGAALADSTLRVPERGNRVPDILDEARWELEFLMRMQVPAGKPLAGMAHAKIHDQNWTGIPMQPEDDPQPRELHAPTTAATLNLAAATAQCARIYAPYDAAFARRCLSVAKSAYAAAKANPAIYQDPNDGNGGGTYGDNDVTDEFYWAAVQLFLTTGENAFWTDVSASRHHTADVFTSSGFSWGGTAALGRLDLATVPSGIPAAERQRIRTSVTAAADAYLATLNAQAYGLPMLGDRGHYFWGANSNVINNLVVLATAFDLTGNRAYRDGAIQGIDYILGRNALNHSYVTGWGDKTSQNQHSRIFAHQADESLPNPPAGSISGGANAFLDDPFAAQLLQGCAPMFCFVDDIESYSTNEVAINWNSALAWIASFLADQGDGQPAATLACRVTYINYGTWQGGTGFTGQVNITNTGSTTIDGWTVQLAFHSDQVLREAWMARAAQAGPFLSARNETYNARITPGGQAMFGFNATTAIGLANPSPELITVNGFPCTS
ncbi:MAG TPA: glycoside hydrolase family 9 protein [Candidatus Limnocylindrales bacterium]